MASSIYATFDSLIASDETVGSSTKRLTTGDLTVCPFLFEGVRLVLLRALCCAESPFSDAREAPTTDPLCFWSAPLICGKCRWTVPAMNLAPSRSRTGTHVRDIIRVYSLILAALLCEIPANNQRAAQLGSRQIP